MSETKQIVLSDLNQAQQDAVLYNDGPHLVIAGAGAGKTRVITYKIAYLLSQGVSPANILALTFTNKAAREMRSRIGALVGDQYARYLWMGTFHHICSRLLREEAVKLGYTHDFTIYDTTDSKNLIKTIVKELQLDDKTYKPSSVLARISQAKNQLVSPRDYLNQREWLAEDRMNRLYQLVDIYQVYQSRLFHSNAMDFDDLLVNMVILLQKDEDVRFKYQQFFQYLLVDEYQDTNYVQYLLVQLLAEPQQQVCVVGDDAQSIYSFRGADIRNILGFQQGYPNARLFKLEQNYRSTQTIVNAANSLIHHNHDQIHKTVYSHNGVGDRIRVCQLATDREEAKYIADQVEIIKRTTHRPLDQIAVLYRTNAQSRAIEDEMRKHSLAYRIYGGLSFYQRKEIKDALAYFRLIVNPKDDEALLRIINVPARGIGDTTMKKVILRAHEINRPIFDLVAAPQDFQVPISPAYASKLRAFAEKIHQWADMVNTMDAFLFAKHVLSSSGLLTATMVEHTQEEIDRYENLQELLSGIQEFCQREMDNPDNANSIPLIRDFLAEVSLLTDQDENLTDDEPRVTLMTIHAAKGLEYGVVFVSGLEMNLFPSAFCQSQREMEEERRLLYVAITRAKDECFLTYAQSRFRNGSVTVQTPSIFLKDIDAQYLLREAPSAPKPQWSSGFLGASPMPSTPRNLRPLKSNNTDPSPMPMSDKESITTPYKPGDVIRHAKFGRGTVIETYRENGLEKIRIDFEGKGPTTMLLTYAKFL